MSNFLENYACDVAVIGAGPAGLSAATTLKKQGVENVLVLDRESEAGGVPRHCGHPPFGIVEYARVMTGPSYARRLAETARSAGVRIALKTSVISLGPEGVLDIVSPGGEGCVRAKKVLLATGARETPRSARLVSGGRMQGISTTGALQSMVYLKNLIPFRRPVVIGSEIVSFSSLMTCRKAGIKPVAMLEENFSPTLQWPLYHAARLFGVPLLVNSHLVNIMGEDRVECVEYKNHKGEISHLECDGVLFTGQFTPESSLARMSHLAMDKASISLAVDKSGRCSDPAYYAAGNLLGSASISFNCWRDGRRTAMGMAGDLARQK